MRLYFQYFLCLLLIEEACLFIGSLHRIVEESVTLWEEDYQVAFCMRYLAWQKNWEVSHEWLAHLGWDEEWLAEAILIAEESQQQRAQQWDETTLNKCQQIAEFFEVYFQPNAELSHPYPNWSIRYLGE